MPLLNNSQSWRRPLNEVGAFSEFVGGRQWFLPA